MLKSSVMRTVLVTAALCVGDHTSTAQTRSQDAQKFSSVPPFLKTVCATPATNPATEALRLVCLRGVADRKRSQVIPADTIVVGFLGGFVKADDTRHPEVLFASYLREHYSSGINVKVFSNHDEKAAMSYVMRGLDRNHDGIVSNEEKERARIIIYGHSWGASETVALAKKLERLGVPVVLTIQVDIISKFGQKATLIPANVAQAINFYQSRGPLHGRSKIVAADSALTRILGNIQMEYDSRSVNCDNYNWFVRTFNKPHHEIENDPLVWSQIAVLVDTNVLTEDSPSQVYPEFWTPLADTHPGAMCQWRNWRTH
jgi:hypothetical protein